MKVEKDTPRVELGIKEHSFTCPAPFIEGHKCSAGDAATLNQTLRENVRNNFAKRLEKALEEAKKKKQSVESVIKAIQTDMDKYVLEYEFGEGRGGNRIADPVKRKAVELAKGSVKKALEKKGYKAADITAAILTEKAIAAVDSGKYPKFMEQAKNILAAEKAAAEATDADLDLEIDAKAA